MVERLQKILSRAGYGSRRVCEALVETGCVRVNGVVATVGDKADFIKDDISVNGASISKSEEKKIYIALNKPRGVLSDIDSKTSRTTVRDLVPVQGHLFVVGRLDIESEGLILLTNDGGLANRLTHPRYSHEKEYRVLVAKRPDKEQLIIWRRGVVLSDGYKTAPAKVIMESSFGKGAWIRVIMREGKKRQIREVGGLLGLPVVKIHRIRIGTLELGNLKPRDWRYLTDEEVKLLQQQKTEPGIKVPKSEEKEQILAKGGQVKRRIERSRGKR
jgi:23S rRNA pseudouridine2605 synthase